jgi:prepilin-type processing-associated H-X9-DG protein
MLGDDHPVGGNIYFVDGHTSWREFGNMWPDKTQPQQPRSMDWNQSPYFWW